jgi:hypothetical protein
MMQLPVNAKFAICNVPPAKGLTITIVKSVLLAFSYIELFAIALALMDFGPILKRILVKLVIQNV